MLVLLGILEDRAKSHTFDYSSTQLLAQWLKDIIVALPQLSEATQSLAGLADSVEISTGRGQSEIWAIFRRDGDEKIDDDLRSAVHRVRDPSKFPLLVDPELTRQFCVILSCKPSLPNKRQQTSKSKSCKICCAVSLKSSLRQTHNGSIGGVWLVSNCTLFQLYRRR